MDSEVMPEFPTLDAVPGTAGEIVGAVLLDAPPVAIMLATAQTDKTIVTIETPESIVTDNLPRKRGRPSKADVAARLNGTTPIPPKIVPPVAQAIAPAKIVDFESLGRVAANLWFVSGELLLGEDWIPAQEEIPLVKNAFRDYFREAGITHISPAWALGITLGSYSLARAQKPSIKSRIARGLEWLKTKLKR